jgi:uncharacterized membrane protein
MVFPIDWAEEIFYAIKNWQPLLPISFVLISGVSFNLSQSNVKRGIKLLLIGTGITIVTRVVLPSETIWFGIIHLLGVANIICGLLKKPLQKIPAVFGTIIFILPFAFTYNA